MTKYNFKVHPKALHLMIDNLKSDEYYAYTDKYKEFRFKYNDEPSNSKYALFEIMSGESDNLQMIITGITDDGTEETIAYYFIGEEPVNNDEDEIREYNAAIGCLNEILKCYKISE